MSPGAEERVGPSHRIPHNHRGFLVSRLQLEARRIESMTAEDQDHELSLVQLGDYEIDPKLLLGPGTDIEGAFSGPARDIYGSRAFVHGLPALGWRPIAKLDETRYQGRREVIAAPCIREAHGSVAVAHQQPGAPAWAVLALEETHDHRWTIRENGCHSIQAGRPTRRRYLHLSWPTPASTLPTDQPRLPPTIELTNISDQPWSNDADDRTLIIGSASDSHGRPFPDSAPGFYAAGGPLPTLEPHGSLVLGVNWAKVQATVFPPGQYQYQATLLTLRLKLPSQEVRVI